MRSALVTVVLPCDVDDRWPKAVLSLAPAPIAGRNGIPVILLRDSLLGTG